MNKDIQAINEAYNDVTSESADRWRPVRDYRVFKLYHRQGISKKNLKEAPVWTAINKTLDEVVEEIRYHYKKREGRRSSISRSTAVDPQAGIGIFGYDDDHVMVVFTPYTAHRFTNDEEFTDDEFAKIIEPLLDELE